MTKPREKTREELQSEIEDGKKKIRQFENREKMLRQKLSKEERRTRSHRLIVRGAVFESIVPEAKGMTDEETAALLRLTDIGGFAATRGCTPCAALRLSLHTHKNSTPAVGVCTIFAGFIILSGR